MGKDKMKMSMLYKALLRNKHLFRMIAKTMQILTRDLLHYHFLIKRLARLLIWIKRGETQTILMNSRNKHIKSELRRLQKTNQSIRNSNKWASAITSSTIQANPLINLSDIKKEERRTEIIMLRTTHSSKVLRKCKW